MMVVFTFRLEMQGTHHGVGQRTEEMFHHLRAEIAHALVAEFGFEFDMWTTRDIQRAARQALVHWQHKTKTANAALVAQGFQQCLAQRQTGIFNRVMVVDIQIAFHFDIHAKAAVHRNLIQHVVKEAHTGVNLAAAFAIQPQFNANLGFFGVALHQCVTVSLRQLLLNGLPVLTFCTIANTLNAHILGQLNIGLTVANHIALSRVESALCQPGFHHFGFLACGSRSHLLAYGDRSKYR
ncbi:Hypothetical Protein PANA_2470 [Pantoea ananatis LMG 20103]|uniref:Uncharacterized protein n=1 Tax=Pantoea ananatis (strain LMG 20103) TaxID=706191 RepID=D4GHX0_PANAM|nr:Hypothetical Protein PANA_2470 [Pantoea ananatis LMG 20103]